MTINLIKLMLLFLVILGSVVPTFGEEAMTEIVLKEPQITIGKPLMEVLQARQSSREFSKKPVSDQDLSNLLWAACGVNRKETGKRTAPTAMNWQEIDVYVALPSGLYLYDAKRHVLKQIIKDDLRAQTGLQPFVADAPVNLIFVADFSRMGDGEEKDKVFYSATDSGFISQNVYLYCASQGLVTVVRGYVDRTALSTSMKLKENQRVILAQTVGYPVK